MEMITATGIEKSFGSLKILKGLDLHIRKAEVAAVVGASGAGKSTLLNILGTLLLPDKGSLTIDGTDVMGLGDKALSQLRSRKIGFVFQAHHLLPEFSAQENVMIPALIAGCSEKQARAKALELLGRVGLEHRTSHKPSEMSGGEQQRVAIARALVNSPAVLLADEPSGNLDSATKEDIHRLFFELRESLDQTMVIVTHDNSLASMCDRALVMKDGVFIG